MMSFLKSEEKAIVLQKKDFNDSRVSGLGTAVLLLE